jgi:RimJ/RimL family protein N-acetyltransferase
MFDLWRHPEVCAHAGPCVDSSGHPISLPASSPRESDRLLQYWLDRARSGNGFRWAVVVASEERFAGAVGFNSLGACAEYAYHLVPRFWGVGLATEASRMAIGWARSEGAQSVELFIPPANDRSVALAQRLGFERSTPARAGAERFLLAGRAA